MGIAAIAHHFHPHHPKGGIPFIFNGVFSYGLRKTWPPGAGGKFYSRVEQRIAAADTIVFSFVINTAQRATVWGLCSLFTGDAELFGSQQPFPFCFCFLNALLGSGVAVYGKIDYFFPG